VTYIPLAEDEVWGCVPVIAAYEIHYIAIGDTDLEVLDYLDPNDDPTHPYRKKLKIQSSGIEVALVWCLEFGDKTSVRFLVPKSATAWIIGQAERCLSTAKRNARSRGLAHDPPGFGRRRRP
jgi:hypothetical protein